MTLQEQRAFCEALWCYVDRCMEKEAQHERPESRRSKTEMIAAAILTLHFGWARFDGHEIVDCEVVAVTREAALAYLEEGKPFTKADIIDASDNS